MARGRARDEDKGARAGEAHGDRGEGACREGGPPEAPSWGADPLGPAPHEALARAGADLRAGLAVRIGAHLVGAVETLPEARAALLLAQPGACLALTARRAHTLRARAYDGDLARLAPPIGGRERTAPPMGDREEGAPPGGGRGEPQGALGERGAGAPPSPRPAGDARAGGGAWPSPPPAERGDEAAGRDGARAPSGSGGLPDEGRAPGPGLAGAALARWARGVADPTADLARPLQGPFETLRGGDATDARAGLMLARAMQLLPAVIAAPAAGLMAGVAPGAISALAPEAVARGLARAPALSRPSAARVPLAVSEAGRVHVFRPDDGGPQHTAVEIGRPDRADAVLVRLHSACFTGDVLGSLKCDCGPQLHGALDAMAREGAGVLLYLNQEGRGIGLANKMRAYALQDQGFDTTEANHRLGFEDDERDFRLGAVMLRALGITRVRLMTNNPAKIARLEAEGVAVAEHVPLRIAATRHSEGYLAAKARAGHWL